jgi:hypothetical protein
MSVQVSQNTANQAFVLMGPALTLEDQTFAQDAVRGADLEPYTVLAKVSASGKWVPFTDETAVDGSDRPLGISTKKIEQADLVAGDVADQVVYVQIPLLDKNQLIIENSKTLATVITSLKITVEEALRQTNIFVEDTVEIDGYENA